MQSKGLARVSFEFKCATHLLPDFVEQCHGPQQPLGPADLVPPEAAALLANVRSLWADNVLVRNKSASRSFKGGWAYEEEALLDEPGAG